MSVLLYETCLQNLESFGVDLIWFGRLVVILEVLEVYCDLHAFWCPIHAFRGYFDILIT